MPRVVEVINPVSLHDYADLAQLAPAVQELRIEAARWIPKLEGRTVWVINSTEKGGGVAEMLPTQICLLRELGLDIEWVVMETDRTEFFPLTKHIHNLIHGVGDPRLGEEDRALYEAVNRENADALRSRIRPDDILLVHDPQPLGMGAMLREEIGVHAIWRCHIGLDEHLPATDAAWSFLRPYATAYEFAIFSAPEYIPDYLTGHASIIHPALDPLSYKNRELTIHKLVGVLSEATLIPAPGPTLATPFPESARRLQRDGSWAPATEPDDIGLLFRPIVTQVSRWDRLKGFAPLLHGWEQLKRGTAEGRSSDPGHRRIVETARLVLAGPDPASIQDDPEARDVLDDLRSTFLGLPTDLQKDVVLLSLPMASKKHNALMVNTLQRCSTIVAQNSLREGFGLTATEAMWKGTAVMGSEAVGLRQQIRDGLDGRLVRDPEDATEIATTLEEMLSDSEAREGWGRTAQRRVYHEFLIFSQLRRWLETLVAVV